LGVVETRMAGMIEVLLEREQMLNVRSRLVDEGRESWSCGKVVLSGGRVRVVGRERMDKVGMVGVAEVDEDAPDEVDEVVAEIEDVEEKETEELLCAAASIANRETKRSVRHSARPGQGTARRRGIRYPGRCVTSLLPLSMLLSLDPLTSRCYRSRCAVDAILYTLQTVPSPALSKGNSETQ
jgi:hypothetical protein